MKTKKCSKCGEVKGVDGFSKDKSRKSGLRDGCKDCARKYREENRGKAIEYKRKYYEENREFCMEYGRKYYEENKKNALENSKKYRRDNPEKIREYERKYRKEKLPKSYVARCAKIPTSQLSDENYEILKLSILTKRTLKEIKNG